MRTIEKDKYKNTMKTFKSLAEFRKLLKVGEKLHTTYHKQFNGRGEDGKPIWKDNDMGIRELSIVQSNAFAFKTVRTDGKVVDSWCYHPKASDCKIIDNTKLVIYEEDGLPVLTYSFAD